MHSPFEHKIYPIGHLLDVEPQWLDSSVHIFISHLIGLEESQGSNILQSFLSDTQEPSGHKNSSFEHWGGSGQSLNCALQELSAHKYGLLEKHVTIVLHSS